MTKSIRNKILQTFFVVSMVAITIPAIVSNNSAIVPQADAQWFHCESENQLGMVFWAEGPNLFETRARAINNCRMNTPYGVYCRSTGCF